MKKLSLVFAAAIAVGISLVYSARAEVLMYEGFPTGSGAYPTAAKSTIKSYGNALTTEKIVGFEKQNWGSGTGVIYVFGNGTGLSLPDSFADLPSAANIGSGSAGAYDSGQSNGERGVYRQLTSATVSAIRNASELHFRFLLSADAKALGALATNSSTASLPEKSAFGAGLYLSSSSAYGSYRNSNAKTARSIGFAIRRVTADCFKLCLVIVGAEDSFTTGGQVRVYDLVESVTAGATYLCYARIDVDAGTDGKEQIQAFAQDVSDYDPSALLCDAVEANLIDDAGTGAPNSLNFAAGSYMTNGGYFKVDEFALATSAEDIMVLGKAGAPQFKNPVMSGDSGSYTVSATVVKAAAADAGAIVNDGASQTTFSAGEVAEDALFSKEVSLASLPVDKTYQISAYAENAIGAVTNVVGTAYNGTLTLTKVKDADEYKCVPGEVTVSRAAADPYPLTVNYFFTSEATGAAAGKTWVAPEPVVIPADETSATIKLTPIVDMSIVEDITVTLSFTAGNYSAVAQTVDLVIKNLVAPEGYNTWVAVTPGKASDASNWSKGVPTSSDRILFDGDISTVDCEWDGGVNGLSDTVAEWTQAENYTGTVTIDTAYQEANSTFPRLTINGDVKILGGKWTHPVNNTSTATYHLDVKVVGNFNLATGTAIDCRYKGFTKGKKYPNSNLGQHGGSATALSQARDSVYFPREIGNGGNVGSVSIGGGAVWLEIGGAMTMNGDIDVHSWENTGGWGGDGSGAPGAVYISAKSVSGSGVIHAEAPKVDRRGAETASGGRVAIYLTEATELGISATQNILYHGALSSSCAGAGTLFVKTATDTYGTLYIKNFKKNPGHTCGINYHTFTATTPILAGETWTFDRIVFGEEGSLCVPEGTTLVLPNGFKSVEGDSKFCGILYQGGNIVLGDSDAVHTIQGNWIFHANAPYTFDRSVVVKDGAAIGQLRFYNNMTTLSQCKVTVNGNLTVEETGFLWARNTSMVNSGNFESDFASRPAGTYCHAGLVGAYALDVDGNTFGLANATYGSIFNPALGGTHGPGNDGANMNNGGGLLILNVTGDLVLDGLCDASSGGYSYDGNASKGSGGSVNITAKTLSGKGSITADGTRNSCATEANILAYFFPRTQDKTRGLTTCTGGGRVAVKLTGADAVFTDEWKAKITAIGASRNNDNKEVSKYAMSAAGTVYLETAANGAKGGEIIVRNDGCVDNDLTVTPIPAMTLGDAASDFTCRASLTIGDCGRVLLNADLAKMSALTMAADTKLDLNGNTLTVCRAKLGDTKLPVGTYAADNPAVAGFVTDTVGGGSLVVKGVGLKLFLR